jgi:hypothetical protein
MEGRRDTRAGDTTLDRVHRECFVRSRQGEKRLSVLLFEVGWRRRKILATFPSTFSLYPSVQMRNAGWTEFCPQETVRVLTWKYPTRNVRAGTQTWYKVVTPRGPTR